MARETTVAQKAGMSSRTMNFQNPRSWGDRGLDRVWNAVYNRAESLYNSASTFNQRQRIMQALIRMRQRMRDLE